MNWPLLINKCYIRFISNFDGHPNDLHEDYLIHDTITKIVVGI